MSSDTKPFGGAPLMFLPHYTAEVQPAERLWRLANEAVANLEEVLAGRCRILCETPDAIRTATLWHW